MYNICTLYCTTCTGAVIGTSVMYVITLCYFEWTAIKIVVAVYEKFVAKKVTQKYVQCECTTIIVF